MPSLRQRELRVLLFEPLRYRRGEVAQFIATTAIRSLSALGVIVLLQQFLAGILGGQQGLATELSERTTPYVALGMVAGMLLLTMLILSWSTYRNEVTRERLARGVEIGSTQRLGAHLMRLPIEYFERHSAGDLVQMLRQDVAQLRGYLSALVGIVIELGLATGYIAAAVWMSPSLAFWVLLVLPLAAAPLVVLAQRTTRQSFTIRNRNSALMDTIYQVLRGIRVIRVFKGEEAELEAIATRARNYFDAMLDIVRLQSFSHVLLESLSGFSIVLVVIIGGFQVLDGTLGWPSLLAFLIAVRSLQGPLNNVNVRFLEMRRCAASLQRLLDLLAEVGVSVGGADDGPGEQIARFQFDRVSFHRNGIPVLQDISFELLEGESLGVVGPSGSGKTTLLAIAARFFQPSSGRVLINGDTAEHHSLDRFYDEVALVPQEPFLFDTSIRENIRSGRPAASNEDVERVARNVRLDGEIRELPDGFETVLGVGAHGLSQGQAQRLNIARALVKEPSLLLLDEATSSLDPLSDAHIQKLFGSSAGEQIQIIAAHRLATVRNADRILVLQQGRCVGLGEHATLLETCPLYREMWEAQRQNMLRVTAS
jgi:ABC-type multidrug transport system fused ATPase/permease subunit